MIKKLVNLAEKEGKKFASAILEMIDIDDIFEAYDNGALSELVANELDAFIIYNDEKWELMKEYCQPENANYQEAKELVIEDIEMFIRMYLERT